MKKILSVSFGILAVLAIAVSCNKVITDVPGDTPTDNPETPAAKQITISATLSDALTKVTFTPGTNGSGKPMMALAWESGDKLRVANHDAPTSYSDFELNPDCVGKQAGQFFGTPVDATSYDVWVINSADPTNMQVQASDGDTSHIEYVAQATGVPAADLTNITFTEISSVLGIQAKLPAGAAAKITSVVLTASENIFFEGKTLTIGITTSGDADNDDILNLYATLPSGSQAIPTGTTLFVKFNSSDTAHKVYTAYRELGSGLTFASGALNNLKMNCVHTDQYAGKDDDGSDAHPYLIADPYQVAAINGLSQKGSTTYFKMIADVDMTGVTHTPINDDNTTNPTYNRTVNFDGNNKTISNLDKNLFYVFKGSIYNLTLDKSDVTARGIFAEYCQGTGHAITNVTISNGKLKSDSNRCGAIIGRINSGSDGITSVTIANCAISKTNISGAGYVGGVIGSADAIIVVSNCSYSDATVSSSAQYAGGFVGYTSNVASTFTGCQVNKSVVDVSSTTGDMRAGGFAGLLNSAVQVKGCTVGATDAHVTVKAGKSDADNTGKVLNTGGFVGVDYGTITKDNSNNHCKAYVTITCANTFGTPLHLGGFVGFARGSISYCDVVSTMTGLAGQHIGGFAGYIVSDGTVLEHCTVETNVYGNNYTGGFAGYVDEGNITISSNEVKAGSGVNGQSAVGGFAGYAKAGKFVDNTVAGTVTVRANNGGGFIGTTDGGSFTDCNTSAAVTGNGTVIGGFVGNGAVANMTRCSATGNVVKNTANGNAVGGFAGNIEKCTLDGCFATGSVTTTSITSEQVGGFVGQLKPKTDDLASFQNCYSTGAVNGSGRWTGGFIGYIYRAADNCGNVEISKCHATGNVSVTGKSYIAGFIGRTYMASGSHLTIDKCYATGNVSSNQTFASAFIGEIGEATNCTICDCYSTGNISGANQLRGGLIATVNANANTSATISRCYSTCSMSDGSFRLGGLIGNIAGSNCSMDHSAAWNGAVVATSYSYNTNWSSGTIVGTAHPNCHLTDNYRNPDMTTTMWWVPALDYNHPNVDGTTHPLVIRNNEEPYTYTEATVTSLGAPYQFPYHGKVDAGKTLSQLAKTTLGWSEDVWDFTGELPTLK